MYSFSFRLSNRVVYPLSFSYTNDGVYPFSFNGATIHSIIKYTQKSSFIADKEVFIQSLKSVGKNEIDYATLTSILADYIEGQEGIARGVSYICELINYVGLKKLHSSVEQQLETLHTNLNVVIVSMEDVKDTVTYSGKYMDKEETRDIKVSQEKYSDKEEIRDIKVQQEKYSDKETGEVLKTAIMNIESQHNVNKVKASQIDVASKLEMARLDYRNLSIDTTASLDKYKYIGLEIGTNEIKGITHKDANILNEVKSSALHEVEQLIEVLTYMRLNTEADRDEIKHITLFTSLDNINGETLKYNIQSKVDTCTEEIVTYADDNGLDKNTISEVSNTSNKHHVINLEQKEEIVKEINHCIEQIANENLKYKTRGTESPSLLINRHTSDNIDVETKDSRVYESKQANPVTEGRTDRLILTDLIVEGRTDRLPATDTVIEGSIEDINNAETTADVAKNDNVRLDEGKQWSYLECDESDAWDKIWLNQESTELRDKAILRKEILTKFVNTMRVKLEYIENIDQLDSYLCDYVQNTSDNNAKNIIADIVGIYLDLVGNEMGNLNSKLTEAYEIYTEMSITPYMENKKLAVEATIRFKVILHFILFYEQLIYNNRFFYAASRAVTAIDTVVQLLDSWINIVEDEEPSEDYVYMLRWFKWWAGGERSKNISNTELNGLVVLEGIRDKIVNYFETRWGKRIVLHGENGMYIYSKDTSYIDRVRGAKHLKAGQGNTKNMKQTYNMDEKELPLNIYTDGE